MNAPQRRYVGNLYSYVSFDGSESFPDIELRYVLVKHNESKAQFTTQA